MAKAPEELAHVEWLGYVQPVGLVVSIPALLSAQAHINRNILPDHQRFLQCLPHDKFDQPIPELRDFAEFCRTVLGWRGSDLESVVPGDPAYSSLEIPLPEYHETLRPTHCIREYEPKDASRPWMVLIQVLPSSTPLDDAVTGDNRNWQTTPHAKFERLLRETQVPVGLLVNSTSVRLVYAPRGETSGYATFSVAEMVQVAGRPIFAALYMLLCEERLFSLGEKQRLPAVLADSRKYQNHVSNELAQQILAALYELLRGFQAADEATKGELLRAVLAEDPNHVYGGLLTVLMRLVFVLYAEDRGLISSDPVYANFYSITGLFERLRADAGRFPDTMDQRYGAWAQLLTLFRLVYEGGSHGGLSIPPRKGYLFDPDRYNFLEGRDWRTPRRMLDKSAPVPRVPDGVIFRVLNNLLILDGERLSYRTLDVEQIGSVYETMMGFGLEVAQGRSIAVKPKKSHGAPTTINLERLLATKPAERNKWLKANTDQELAGQSATALKDAATVDDLLAALDRRIAKNVTANVVTKGTMVFQPSDERRRSGSHYTPRSLTEPIVRTTLRPILEQLGKQPTPDQVLALNVCDPAMGSGAFLVEVCRQLGDELVKAWRIHKCIPKLPPDEDELLLARRLVAQQCLYGVDKNPMAVDLSKLSLWLATLAKDHPFTFLDHSLRCGDSLVGLSREQIAAFHWQPPAKRAEDSVWFGDPIAAKMKTVTEYRQRILAARDDKPYEQLRQELDVADEALSLARLTGDCVIAAYFSADKDRGRIAKLDTLARQLVKYIGPQGKAEERQPLTEALSTLQGGAHPLPPFHWQIEFPEVFTVDAKGKSTGGFDVIVGNPPFAGKNTIGAGNRDGYLDWLKALHVESHGNADLVAHFFRRAFNLLRHGGTFGLIATNTIAQGDTRSSGLRWICTNQGTIYAAKKRLKWPGQAAVVVSVVNVCRGTLPGPFVLDNREVSIITAYLFHAGGHENPATLQANSGLSFQGTILLGMGFTFDDTDKDGVANPLSLMRALCDRNPTNRDRIFPYIGGDEVNNVPDQSHYRFAIDFRDFPLKKEKANWRWDDADERTRKEAIRSGVVPLDYPFQVAADWPELLKVLEGRVKADRQSDNREIYRRLWWQHAEKRVDLYRTIAQLDRVLVINCGATPHMSFAFLPSKTVFANTLDVFAFQDTYHFALLQSRIHEVWVRRESSSMKDDLRYAPSDCFESFPFPSLRDASVEVRGQQYYDFRAKLMIRNNEGLTKTYNRFHDPDERSADILKLRELHAAMDQAVLDAYGWHDLAQTATREFLLDYEEDEGDEEESSNRRRKKPWRYRWPDEFRDEVLARLLALNAERAEQERLAGLAAENAVAASKPTKAEPSRQKSRKAVAGDLPGGLLERDRERFYIWMLLRAWRKPLNRHALDAGLILMLNDELRAGLLGGSKSKKKAKQARIVDGLDYLLQEMAIQKHISIDNSGPQQILNILPNAPPTDSAPDDDLTRLKEVKLFFSQEIARGNVTESQEHLDAKPDLVST